MGAFSVIVKMDRLQLTYTRPALHVVTCHAATSYNLSASRIIAWPLPGVVTEGWSAGILHKNARMQESNKF